MMRVVLPAVCVVLSLLGGASPAFPQAGQSAVDVYAGADSEGFTSRLIADYEDTRLLWTAVGDPRRPTYHAAGFSLPWAEVGPLEIVGLARQFGSPLEYSAASMVWQERSGLRLFTGRERTSRFGAFISGANGGIGAGAFVDGRTVPHLLALAGAGQGGLLKAGLAVEVSRPALQSPDEAWFPGDDSWPGGSVLHAGMESAYQSDNLHLAVSGLVSRPDRLRPGAVLQAWTGFRLHPLADLDFFAGLGTPEYRTPAGARITRILRASSSLKLRPVSILELRAAADGDCPRSDYARIGPAMTEWSLSLGGTLKSKWMDGRIEYRIDGPKRAVYLGLESDRADLAWRLGGERSIAGQAGEWTISAGCSLDADSFGLDADFETGLGGAGCIEFSLGAWRRMGGAVFRAGLGLEEAAPMHPDAVLRSLGFKIAWEYHAQN